MAKLGSFTLLQTVLCLLMCMMTRSWSEETDTDQGVLAGNFLLKQTAHNDWLNDPAKSDVREAAPPGRDLQLPISDSAHRSQPVIPGTRDDDSSKSPARSETNGLVTDQGDVHSDNNQGFDSAKVSNALHSILSEANGTAVGNNQQPEDNPSELNVHSSEKDTDVLGALERPALNSDKEAGMERESAGQPRNRLDDDGFNTQSSRTDNADVGLLGQSANGNAQSDLKAESQEGREGPVQTGQNDEDSQVLNTQGGHINEAVNLRGPLSETKPETEQTLEAGDNQLEPGVLGASYVRQILSDDMKQNENGIALTNTDGLTASAPSRHPAMLLENVDTMEDQRNDNFEDDNKYEDRENVLPLNGFKGDGDDNFMDAVNVRDLDKSVENQPGVSAVDGSFQTHQQPQVYAKSDWQNGEVDDGDGGGEAVDDGDGGGETSIEIPWAVNPFDQNAARQTEGSMWTNQQPQQYNKPDWQNGQVHDDADGDDADTGIPWAVNPFDQNADRQTDVIVDTRWTEKAAETSTVEHITDTEGRPQAETVKDEDDEDFDEDYYNADDDDWWYFDPDRKKGGQGRTAKYSSRPSSSFFTSSTPRPPAGVAQGDKAAAAEEEEKEPPHIPEGVMEVKDVKKNVNGPKEGILLYTALIVVFIIGIVVFTLWKNASKTGRSKSPIVTLPVGEEGKRLLDHPFV